MVWPLRLSIQGMTIGFFGEPSRPIVEAIGMPISMCVAWMSPFDSASRIAAQLAPLLTVELMPYFLNRPFSWAITMGEQSVSAMMPNLRSGVSGASLAPAAHPARVPSQAAPPTAPAAPVDFRNLLRLIRPGRVGDMPQIYGWACFEHFSPWPVYRQIDVSSVNNRETRC